VAEVRWRKWALPSAFALFVVAGVGLLYVWQNRPGRFSYSNFQRIQNGMTREQVTELLGSPGEETESIPGFPPYVPGAPPGWTGVVWGDTFVHWQSGDREIYVGFLKGRVTSKHYWEPSL
jgi:hypothetical protein